MSHSMKIPLQSKLNLCKLLSRYNCSFRKSSESHYTFSFFTFDGKHQFPQIEFGHSVYFLSSFYVYSLWDEPLNIVVTTYIVYSSSCTVGKRAYAWNRGTARDAPRKASSRWSPKGASWSAKWDNCKIHNEKHEAKQRLQSK